MMVLLWCSRLACKDLLERLVAGLQARQHAYPINETRLAQISLCKPK